MNIAASYDEVPYESLPATASHPERMYTAGFLFGLNPQPVTSCRVLELGCADGGNLVPMAYNLPHSEFVGLDLSGRQIDMGRAVVKGLDLPNLRLEQASILDVDQSYGLFDYIICHGVYSWVPPEVREKIMAVLAENLTEHGVGYVDFNTYPGWYGPEALRELMRFHTDGLDDPRGKVAQSLSIVDFLGRFMQTEDQDYSNFIKKEVERIKKVGSRFGGGTYVYHEYLEDINHPEYFHQFARKADKHGLQYLGESIFANMLTHGFPPEAAQILSGVGHDIVQLEQYMDFLRHRRFRNTLLCRKEHRLDRAVAPDDLRSLMAVCTANVTDEMVEQAPGSSRSKAALTRLMETRPRALPCAELFDQVIAGSSETDAEAARGQMAADFIRYYSLNMIQLRSWQADFTVRPGDRPRASDIVLYQVSQGQRWLSNQCHEPSILPLPIMGLTPLLDGTRDRAELAGCLERIAEPGDFSKEAAGAAPPPSPEQALDQMLSRLAAKALLLE